MMTYHDHICARSRFNLWVSYHDGSKVLCWGDWADMAELAQPVLAELPGKAKAVHVLPDGEEPSWVPNSEEHHFNDEPEDEIDP